MAVLHTWPELKNAEAEVIRRIVAAAQNVDVSVAVIDNNGRILSTHGELGLTVGTTLLPEQVSFVLSLHFESPRVLDIYSYVTLWQPIDYYHIFSYQASIDKLSSHNDLVSCDSELADSHAMNIWRGGGRLPLAPLPKMFHGVPQPFLAPKVSKDSRAFYIGVNWERLGNPKGRFHDVLASLDAMDLTDIYGPQTLFDVAIWEGYKTYRGELPFDGNSVQKAINETGICLALSSPEHKRTGILSNRLFEGLGGGAAIIATPNAIIDKYFRDAVYLVDDSRGEEYLVKQIIDAVHEIRANPAEAQRRTIEGQRVLRDACSLERSIEALIAGHATRVGHFEKMFLAPATVTVILTACEQDWEALHKRLDQFSRQKSCKVNLEIICDRNAALPIDSQNLAAGAVQRVTFHRLRLCSADADTDLERTGSTVLEILRAMSTQFFAFFTLEDEVFSDHFASLSRTVLGEPGAMAACSGMIRKRQELAGGETRALDSLRFVDFDSITLVNGEGQRGRFLFKSELITDSIEDLLPMLDGEEHSYFRLLSLLAGPIAQSGYASYVCDLASREPPRTPVEPVHFQRQYIRDAFARNARWLDRLAKGTKIPEFVYAYSPGVPAQWANLSVPPITRVIPLDTHIETRAGTESIAYLKAGFSYPEATHIWIEGERGIIEFSLPAIGSVDLKDYEFAVTWFGRRSRETGREQHCTVAINGAVVHYAVVPEQDSDKRLQIPPSLRAASRKYRVELIPDHSEQVLDHSGAVLDPRRLSIALVSFGVFLRIPATIPLIPFGAIESCGRQGSYASALFAGFHAPDGEGALVAGREGVLMFDLESVPERPYLHLYLSGRRSLATGAAQTVLVCVNDLNCGEHQLTEVIGCLVIDISTAVTRAGRAFVTLVAKHAEATFESSHDVVDSRLVGVRLEGFGVAGSVPVTDFFRMGRRNMHARKVRGIAKSWARRILPTRIKIMLRKAVQRLTDANGSAGGDR